MKTDLLVPSKRAALCCFIGPIPTHQKPHNIIRTVNLFDLFVGGLVALSSVVDIRNSGVAWAEAVMLAGATTLAASSAVMVNKYNRMVEKGVLVWWAEIYCFVRM